MSAAAIIQAKREMEARIAGFVQGRVLEFQEQTGFAVSSVAVYMECVTSIMEEPRFVVSAVKTTLEI